jgi:uncharacterized protein
MFIDIHVHPVFYEPIKSNDAREGYRREAISIYKNAPAPIERIFNQMDCAGLDKLCLLPLDYSSLDGDMVVTNEEISELVNISPDRFIGFASVDPFDKNACDKLEYAFLQLKLKGLKLNPSKQRYYPYDETLEPIYKICEKHGKPILFHSGISWEKTAVAKYSRPIEFEELAQKHPDLKFCLGHFGWPWIKETAALMLKYPNIYADTALLYFDSAYEFYSEVFINEIPATWIDRSLRHQIMFGSNYPRFEQIRMAKALKKLPLRESTMELIQGQNALEFLNII